MEIKTLYQPALHCTNRDTLWSVHDVAAGDQTETHREPAAMGVWEHFRQKDQISGISSPT